MGAWQQELQRKLHLQRRRERRRQLDTDDHRNGLYAELHLRFPQAIAKNAGEGRNYGKVHHGLCLPDNQRKSVFYTGGIPQCPCRRGYRNVVGRCKIHLRRPRKHYHDFQEHRQLIIIRSIPAVDSDQELTGSCRLSDTFRQQAHDHTRNTSDLPTVAGRRCFVRWEASQSLRRRKLHIARIRASAKAHSNSIIDFPFRKMKIECVSVWDGLPTKSITQMDPS